MTRWMRQVRRAKELGPDRGVATLEQLGAVVVAALLVLGFVGGAVTYGPRLSNELCQLAQNLGIGGACEGVPVADGDDGDEGPDHEDFRPPSCTLQTTASEYSSKFKVAFLTFGEDAGFIVSESSDGTVTVTVTNGASAGVEVGAGAKGGGEDSTIGADVSLGGDIKVKVGDTWTFANMADWEKHEEQLNKHLVDLEVMKQPYGGLSFLFRDFTEAPRDPNIKATTVSISATLSGQAGLRLSDGTDASGKPTWFNPNLGVYGSGKLTDSVTQTTNSTTGETSETYTFSASGEIGLNAGTLNPNLEGKHQDAYKITRDKNGEIVKVSFMREQSGGGGVELDLDSSATGSGGNKGVVKIGSEEKQRTVTVTELAVDGSNRAVIDEWVAQNVAAAAQGLPAYFPGNAYNPTATVEGDPFADLLHKQAKTAKLVYDDVEDSWSFGAEFALGLKLGASISGSETESKVSSAFFLGAPDPSGTRSYLPDETCSR